MSQKWKYKRYIKNRNITKMLIVWRFYVSLHPWLRFIIFSTNSHPGPVVQALTSFTLNRRKEFESCARPSWLRFFMVSLSFITQTSGWYIRLGYVKPCQYFSHPSLSQKCGKAINKYIKFNSILLIINYSSIQSTALLPKMKFLRTNLRIYQKQLMQKHL